MTDRRSSRGTASGRGVSRRAFVKRVGATGLAVGVTSCSTPRSGDGATIPEGVPDEEMTLEVAAGSNFVQHQDAIQRTLVENGGFPENVTVEFKARTFSGASNRRSGGS